MSRTSTRPRHLVAGVALLALAATACGSDTTPATSPTASTNSSAPESAAPASGTAAVDIKDFLFAPDTIEVAVGTTVTWTNQDRFGHTATSGAPREETGEFDIVMGLTTDKDTTGLSGSTTFDTAGTFEYFCRYHPSMVGTVTVT